jgi:uncharacterized RDD family membrane protein YckC
MWNMAWYYKHGDQEMGPVGKADLQALIKAKKISGKTLVRNTEADQWRPLAEMVRKKPAAAVSPPPPPPQEDPSGADSLVSPQAGLNAGAAAEAESSDTDPMSAVCSQCGRSFPHDQVLTYEGRVICAACKPMFVQKLKEGVSLPTSLNYAGFWIRFLAKIIDGIVLGITQWIIMIPFGMMVMSTSDFSQGQGPSAGFFALMGVQQLIGILIPAAYNTFFIGRFGATLGKMACQLRVVMPEGEQVSYLRALGRNFAEWISAIILLIGYIMAGFDDEKRALHDRICSTRVVRK